MSETNSHPPYSWVSLDGQFDIAVDEIIFRGYTPPPLKADGEAPRAKEPAGGVGRLVSNQRMTDGTISLDVEFKGIDHTTTAEIMLHFDPAKDEMLTVGLGGSSYLINVRHWTHSRAGDNMSQEAGFADDSKPHWNDLRFAGDRRMMKSGKTFHLEAKVQGSFLTFELDGVEIGSGTLPFQLSGKQVGLFCQSRSDIHIRHFRVTTTRPQAFVVMQFNPPEYEELFNDVIAPVCKSMELEPFRASQTYYPGLIIADIQRQIRESRVVIAEITPVNPNVYYEVGYADAIGKPVILIADGGKLEQLPFDVRAFRTLFYENTIGGKAKVEKTLTDYLKNIMGQKSWN